MGTHAELHVHQALPTVKRVDRTLWLSIPLSETGQPTMAFFLSLQAAQDLLVSLQTAIKRYTRFVALEAEHET